MSVAEVVLIVLGVFAGIVAIVSLLMWFLEALAAQFKD